MTTTENIRVAVFCGFGEGQKKSKNAPQRPSELLFAYQILALFAKGTLSKSDKSAAYAKRRLKAADVEHGKPLFGKFSLFNVPNRDGVLVKIKEALSDDTFGYVLVVFPHRPCKCGKDLTTPFVPMEFALAEGLGKSPVAFVEEKVNPAEIPLVEHGTRVITQYSREEVQDKHHWKEIHNDLLGLEQEALRNSLFQVGLPDKPIQDFYERLCRYLLTAREVQIYNHSHLPLGSRFDPRDTGKAGHIALQWRDRYFEFEEALLGGSWTRFRRAQHSTLDQSEKRLLKLMKEQVQHWAPGTCGAFKLKRVLSVPDARDISGWDAKTQANVRNRYISIFQHIARIEKRQLAKPQHYRIGYRLCAFPTRTLHSLPTTVLVTHENHTRTGIWGFLRNPAEKGDTDYFFVSHNCPSTVEVFAKHLSSFFDQTGNRPDEPMEVLLREGEWDSTTVECACYMVCAFINNPLFCKTIASELKEAFYKPAAGFAAWAKKMSRTPDNAVEQLINSSKSPQQ